MVLLVFYVFITLLQQCLGLMSLRLHAKEKDDIFLNCNLPFDYLFSHNTDPNPPSSGGHLEYNISRLVICKRCTDIYPDTPSSGGNLEYNISTLVICKGLY